MKGFRPKVPFGQIVNVIIALVFDAGHWPTNDFERYPTGMGEHIQRKIADQPRLSRKRPAKRTADVMGRRLLEIVVYDKQCRIGGSLTLNDLAETAIGDWKMPDFRAARWCAVSQGWLIVADDALTLTTAGPVRTFADQPGGLISITSIDLISSGSPV